MCDLFISHTRFFYSQLYFLVPLRGRGGGVLPYMGYMGMCHCKGYGFQTVYSRIVYHFSGN